MKHLLLIASAAVALAVAVPAASADGSFQVHLFGCASGNYQASLVPHDTPLFVNAGWISGTQGLVQAFINDNRQSLTDARASGTTTYPGVFGPIVPSSDVVINGWASPVIYNLPPLASGQSATLTLIFTIDHNYTDLGRPIDGSGLQYLEHLPAGTTTLVCTITAV